MYIEVVTAAADDTNENSGIGDGLVAIPVLHGLQKKNPNDKIILKVRPHQMSLCRLFWPNCEIEQKLAPGQTHVSKADMRLRTSSTGFWSTEDALARTYGLSRMGLIAARFDAPPCFEFEPDISKQNAALFEKEFDNYFVTKEKAPVIVMSVGANQLVRQWPAESFLWLAQEFMLRGFRVLLVGDSMQRYGVKLFKMRLLNFPWLPSEKLISIIRKADLFVGNDSGLTHLAGLLKTKTIALCGLSVGSIIFGGYESVRAVQASRACSGCLGMPAHGYLPACTVACRALLELAVDTVLKEALNHLGQAVTN
jgi:ADP-heptose:LPS heptosyltransferase